jgi:hypothetical protein
VADVYIYVRFSSIQTVYKNRNKTKRRRRKEDEEEEEGETS